MNVLPAYVYVPCIFWGQWEGIRYYGTDLWIVVRQHIDVGNQIQVLCKDIKCSQHLCYPSPQMLIFDTDIADLGLQLTFLSEELNKL